jgi:hypothetical protein
MLYTDDIYPFETDNRAWQRFTVIAREHFEVSTWTREDGRPTMISVVDLASGDAFTMSVLDSVELSDSHVVLAQDSEGVLAVHGPFKGEVAASEYEPTLAAHDTSVAATLVLPLQQPHDCDLHVDELWRPLPSRPLAANRPVPADPSATVLILRDADRLRLAAVGPFSSRLAARAWKPATLMDGVELNEVALILPDLATDLDS